ncbi:uncharacterized protein LOC131244070 [Magnolia sinica]|uniref:uncharacterized protein LOC131244070 n=1 Tax=Magnolia sinica TaxID=86752 RepID=UPI00265AC36A|nr:uncharacterized protein LOC131244070 [Magnolia sinica]
MYAFRFFKIGSDKDKGNDNGGSKGGDDNGGSKGGSIDLSRGGSINDISTGKTPKHRSTDNTFTSRTPSLFRSTSTRAGDPIMFSYSTVRRKPPPVEKTLECTLEDLLHGCVKKIMLTREVLADNGIMVQEEELLRIKVKPGWKEGTKITFEGIGDERPGMLPADVIFSISEIQHPLFKREGNDLVLTLQIPLVKALTGCTLSIPLPGGDKMSCSFNEIIYPGYEKIVAGHGMPIAKEHGLRGDLRIIFDVEFPKKLSEKRRRDVFRILQDGA